MRVRREKLDRMRDRGVEPYPVTFPRTTTIADLRAAHPDLEPDQRSGDRVGVAGRVVLSRTGGKLCFATLRDGTGEVQVMLSLDEVGEEALAHWKADVDLGDHVGIEGEVISSRRGELSVLASSVDDAREGAAAAARQAQGPHRPGGAGADALRRPRGQRRLAADGAQPRDRAALGARHPAPARLPRGRDTAAAAAARRRGGPAVHDAPQRVRPDDVPAHRDRAVPQAAHRRRPRPGLRDRPQLPQRGRRLHAQPGVHDARGLRGLRRLRHDGRR